MTDQTDQADSAASPSPEDDPRFQVKWRKKASGSSSPTPAAPFMEEQGETEDTSGLRRRLEEAEQRIVELQDRWHRAEANLANLRKRNEQEKSEVEKFASLMLVAELLPVLDNFERALVTVPGNLAMLTWIQGVMLIERHLRAILDHQSLAPIEAQGQPFNPHVHEAIGERETAEVAPGNIIQVYQPGYTMHGRVIRPALVEIATAPTDKTGSAPVEGTDTAEAEIIAEATAVENPGP